MKISVCLIAFWVFFAGFAPMDAVASTDTKADMKDMKTPKSNFQSIFTVTNSTYDSKTESSAISALYIQNLFTHNISPTLGLTADLWLLFGSGHSESRFGGTGPFNLLWFSEAAMFWKPLSFLTIYAGTLNQSYLNTPLLIDYRGFPGVKAELKWEKNKYSSEIILQKSVPSSSNLSAGAAEKETTPSFETQTLNLKFPLSAKIMGHAFVTNFRFKDLSPTTIGKGYFFGNTITKSDSSPDQFAYSFEGLTYGGHLEAKFGKSLKIDLGGYLLENQKAPDSFNFGKEIFSRIKYDGAHYIYSLNLKSFYNESDAAPVFYNSFHLGYNNREGHSVSLGFRQKEMNFKISTGYIKSHLIKPSEFQEDQTYYYARFETDYNYSW